MDKNPLALPCFFYKNCYNLSFKLGNFPAFDASFFSCDFTLRSNFLISSDGGKSSGLIPLCPSISLIVDE